MTTSQGHPVFDNQNSQTAGEYGPMLIQDFQYIDKLAKFDRERIPERVVHARGFLAHGTFTPTGTAGDEPITTYTRAKVFTADGNKRSLTLSAARVRAAGAGPETGNHLYVRVTAVNTSKSGSRSGTASPLVAGS